MIPAILLATILTVPAPMLAPQGESDEPPPIRLDQSLEKALAEAKSAKTFVFVALPEDWAGEGHGSLQGNFWYTKGLRRALAKARVVVGSPFKHTEHESGSDRDGNPMNHVCSRFGQMVCEQHREVEKQAVAKYFEGLDPAAKPAYLVLRGSDGAVVARRLGDATSGELTETIKAAAAAIESGDDPIVPAELLGKCLDGDAGVRIRALYSLASLEFAAADSARKKMLEEAKDERRRAEILLAMAECGSRCDVAVSMAHVESKNAEVRCAALRALGGSGHVAGVDPLVKAWAKAREDEEKKAVVRALGRCGRQSDAAKELLRKAAADTKIYVRANGYIALSEAFYNDAATAKLLKSKIESDGDARARGAAVFALVTLRNADTKDTIAFIRARKPKEKDAKVIEVMNAGVAYLEGSLNDDFHWPLEIFCGDPKR